MSYKDVRAGGTSPLLLSLYIFFYTGTPILAQSAPGGDVSVVTTPVDNHFEVVVENNNPFDVTLTLSLSGENFRSTAGNTSQKVYGPNTREVAMQVYPADEGKSISIRTDYSWFMGDINARHNDAYIYGLPFASGMEFRLGQGYNGDFSHSGKSRYALDFMMPEGTPVYAVREGVVINVKEDSDRGGPSEEYMEFSNFVVIRHDDGTMGEYAHFRYNGVSVEAGQRVRKGDQIGISGNTGFSSGPHLHFMVTRTTPDGTSQSIPFKFRAQRGLITNPREGELYRSN